MREYGQIQCSYWRDREIRKLAGGPREFGAYLLTNPHSNGIGCYYLPDGYVIADLGWTEQTITEGFVELSRIGFVKRCSATFFVLLPKFLYWNEIANPNVALARIKEFDTVPKKSGVYAELCECLKRFGKHWPKEFEQVLEDGRKQDPTLPERKEPEPDPEREAAPAARSPATGGGNGASQAKGTRFRPIPLSDDWRAVAKEMRPDVDVEKAYAAFSDYWVAKPGQHGLKLDWLATWRNWLRKEDGPRGGPPKPPAAPTSYGPSGRI